LLRKPPENESETAANRVELVADFVAETAHGGDRSNGYQGCDQSVLNQILARIVDEQTSQEPRGAVHFISPRWCGNRSSGGSPAIKPVDL
jgi:hypothetical protein